MPRSRAQVHARSAHPQHLAVRTSFGIVSSHDGGVTWGWVCEPAVGYTDVEPAIAISGDGSVIAGWQNGVAAAASDGCSWQPATGIDSAADVTVQKDDTSLALAVTAKLLSPSYLSLSSDHGVSFQALGAGTPTGFVPTTFDVAPSDPARIYVAGLDDGTPSVARTFDRAVSWELTALPVESDSFVPYVAAIDPNDAERVYVRTNSDPGRLLVSVDGGASWVEAFSGTGPLRAFALSPNGEELLVADVVSVWKTSSASLLFEKASDTIVNCLTWAEAGVYACSNDYAAGFFVGLSSDEGASFVPLLSMHCIVPLACESGTSAGDLCPAEWPAVAAQLGTDACDPGEGGANPAGGGSAQAGGASNAGGAGGHAAGATPAPAAPSSGAGCACHVGTTPARAGWPLVLLALLRRRGRRHAAS